MRTTRFLSIPLLLALSLSSVRADGPPDADVRLRTPIKVVTPGAGWGGVNLEEERWGFINVAGELVIPPQWDAAAEFQEGYARVRNGKKSGFIDIHGKVVVPLEYDDWEENQLPIYEPRGFSEGLAAVRRDGKWGFVDPTGAVAIPLQWDAAGDFSEGLAAVERKGKWGFIDPHGTVVLAPRWDGVSSFFQGIATYQDGNKTKAIDRHGKPAKPPVAGADVFKGHADSVGDFHDGLAKIRLQPGGPTGYINEQGKIVIPPRWSIAHDFSEGLAAVNEDWEHECFIDTTGKVMFGRQWRSTDSFLDGLATVSDLDNQGYFITGVINTRGETLISPVWRTVKVINGYLFASHRVDPAQGNSYAWFDRTGKKLWQSGPQPTPVP